MGKKLRSMWVFCVILVAVMLAGCGSDSYDMAVNGTASGTYGEKGSVMGDGFVVNESTEDSSTTTALEEDAGVSTNRKIIERVHISVQTKEFDALIEKLNAEISTIGGYVENSSISGNGYGDVSGRYADFTVRIPADASDAFSAFVSENSTVTNKEVETEDVTLSYVDMESRVSALETEKATLERLLAEAGTMADVISIQDRLTEVIYEIESVKSKLRTYDNLIEYTTVTIQISEVERVDVVEKQTVWEEIKTNLVENFENVGHGFERFFVFIVSSIPYLLVIGGLVAIILVVIVVYRRKKNGK